MTAIAYTLPLLLPPPDVHDGPGIGQLDLGTQFKTTSSTFHVFIIPCKFWEKNAKLNKCLGSFNKPVCVCTLSIFISDSRQLVGDFKKGDIHDDEALWCCTDIHTNTHKLDS